MLNFNYSVKDLALFNTWQEFFYYYYFNSSFRRNLNYFHTFKLFNILSHVANFSGNNNNCTVVYFKAHLFL